jgi:hypothetical protein
MFSTTLFAGLIRSSRSSTWRSAERLASKPPAVSVHSILTGRLAGTTSGGWLPVPRRLSENRPTSRAVASGITSPFTGSIGVENLTRMVRELLAVSG